MNQAKVRLDKLIFSLGLVDSRNIAQSIIIRGLVLVDDEPVTKPGSLVKPDCNIRIKDFGQKFVSRAGEKLEHALDFFNISVKDLVSLDVGSSTGGFTDCLLSRGASLVYAVDVGTNQLAYKLRKNTKVEVFENTHANELNLEMFSKEIELAVVDVSFIAVRKILKHIIDVLKEGSKIIVLVKPQFELEKSYISSGGVVKSEKDQLLAVKLVTDFAESINLENCYISSGGVVKSPILGAKKGNQEYLVLLSKKLKL